MMTMVRGSVAGVLLAGVVASLAYGVIALLRVILFRRRETPRSDFAPAVTILKPVCGIEPGLFDCLRSFCEQDYPDYQVVFGVGDARDEAVPVIERLLRESKHPDLTLVVDGRRYGGNYKMSNLTNMMASARHDILVVADADSLVQRDYLRAVVAEFESPRVGAVTCLYVGKPLGGLASALGAAFMNDWFLPSVLFDLALEKPSFCFGATMAIRRDALESIGGFIGLTPYLADDYLLGRRVRDLGLEVRLASPVVRTVVSEPDFRTLWQHELRWGRTFRTVRPIGWILTLTTDTMVLALAYLLASGASALSVALLGASILVRLGTHAAVRRRFGLDGPSGFWLVPLRDLLSFGVRVASFVGYGVVWKGEAFVIRSAGRLQEKEGIQRSS